MGFSFWSLNRGNRGFLKILNFASPPAGMRENKNDTFSCRICVINDYIILKIRLHAIRCQCGRRSHSSSHCSVVHKRFAELFG